MNVYNLNHVIDSRIAACSVRVTSHTLEPKLLSGNQLRLLLWASSVRVTLLLRSTWRGCTSSPLESRGSRFRSWHGTCGRFFLCKMKNSQTVIRKAICIPGRQLTLRELLQRLSAIPEEQRASTTTVYAALALAFRGIEPGLISEHNALHGAITNSATYNIGI